MWHTKREGFLTAVAALMTVAAGVLFVLYLTKSSDPGPRSIARITRPGATGPPSAEPARVRSMKAGYSVGGKWRDGFNAEVTVTNLGSQPVEGWTVQLKMPDGVDLTSTWGATIEQRAGTVTLRSQPWNTYLAPGAAIRMGFEAKGEPAEPRSCTINGSPC